MSERDDTTGLLLHERQELALDTARMVLEQTGQHLSEIDIEEIAGLWTLRHPSTVDPESDPFGIGMSDYELIRDWLFEIIPMQFRARHPNE